jgi:hypothetical protein
MPYGRRSATERLYSNPNAWHTATRPCSIEVAASAGKPIASPAAKMPGTTVS